MSCLPPLTTSDAVPVAVRTQLLTVPPSPHVHYVLRLGDTALVQSQRLAEWCGHGPVLEEDIALANIALDLLGQARALLTHAGRLIGAATGHAPDEDQLAYWRDERQYLNLTLVELRGRKGGADFADTVLRLLFVSTWLQLHWQLLASSTDAELSAIAGQAVKEAQYHREHAATWAVRLGDGTDVSAARMQAALMHVWPYVGEMFDTDGIDAAAADAGVGPRRADLRAPWLDSMAAVFGAAHLPLLPGSAFRATGSAGLHSEHMGPLLAEMQFLQRSHPQGHW